MARVVKSNLAEADAIEIWLRIAEDDPRAATELIRQIDQRLKSLSIMPLSAEAVPQFGPHVRRSSVGNYVIYYRPIDHGIEVARILHGARRAEDLL